MIRKVDHEMVKWRKDKSKEQKEKIDHIDNKINKQNLELPDMIKKYSEVEVLKNVMDNNGEMSKVVTKNKKEVKKVGDVTLTEDEEALLAYPPKFCVL